MLNNHKEDMQGQSILFNVYNLSVKVPRWDQSAFYLARWLVEHHTTTNQVCRPAEILLTYSFCSLPTAEQTGRLPCCWQDIQLIGSGEFHSA